MKKIVSLMLVLILLFGCTTAFADKATAAKTAKEAADKLPADQKYVNVFTWTYYIPDEVVYEFEQATGIRINYAPFSSNEEMLGVIGHSIGQYDLMVVSDYDVMLECVEFLDEWTSHV